MGFLCAAQREIHHQRERIKLLFEPTVCVNTHTHTYTVIPEKHQGYIMQSNTSNTRVHVHKQPTTAPITVTGLISELCYRAAESSNKKFIYLVQLVDVVTQPQRVWVKRDAWVHVCISFFVSHCHHRLMIG